LETLSDEAIFTLSHDVIPSPSAMIGTYGSARNPDDVASYRNPHRDSSAQNASE
jgi:hypothetical protein